MKLLLFAAAALAVVVGVTLWWLRRRARRSRDGAVVAALPAQRRVDADALPLEDAAQPAPVDHEVSMRLCAIAFDGGDGRLANPLDPAHAEVVRVAGAILARLEPGSRYAPRRPRLLPLLLQAVNDEDSSGRDIADIVAQDPALAGNLLRVANSAFYRVREQPIESIERAVSMIGTDGVRRLIAVALVQPVLDVGQDTLGRMLALVWRHSLLAAAAAVVHARQVEHVSAFGAQMSSLVHGLGAVVVVRVVRDAYARYPAVAPDAGTITVLLERWAVPAAQRLADDWELSADMAKALDDQRRNIAFGHLSPLGRSLRIGGIAGMAALRHQRGEIDDADACALLRQWGLREQVATRIWRRLAQGEAQTAAT